MGRSTPDVTIILSDERIDPDERKDHTRQPTALVSEAYLNMIPNPSAGWPGRAQFFAAAAEAMRRVLSCRSHLRCREMLRLL